MSNTNINHLDDFAPREPRHNSLSQQIAAIDNASAFPSREPQNLSQINIKADIATLNAFRVAAKKERYNHGEFLQIILEHYKQSNGAST